MSKLQEQAEKWRYKCIQLQNANEELGRCIIDIKRQFCQIVSELKKYIEDDLPLNEDRVKCPYCDADEIPDSLREPFKWRYDCKCYDVKRRPDQPKEEEI